MILKIIYVGKTGKSFLIEGEKEYASRLGHYLKLEVIEIPDVKNARKLSAQEIKNKEGEAIKTKLKPGEKIFLLDEKGKEYTSVGLAKFLQKQFNSGGQGLTFIIGGPYGFSDEIYDLSSGKVSLSQLTFSHQMVRMFFLEQLYRAMTILKGEPYHHM
ncbi:MAG: 23S rRNA (pseudouridine(1915)-N(3))-methyltransferase RlmH [Brumimicrobium sp.]|nr:23S rRNA (pseudouridine(1915)-N(3))-methyltransferase RlmH [Brumimicrobium sp.]